MQRAGAGGGTEASRPFQYPRSDRRRCNFQAIGSAPAGIELSVSSVGSEAMQPSHTYPPAQEEANFQYPRSDRRRCNVDVLTARAGICPAFSILGRIGGDATADTVGVHHRQSRPFSILGRIGGDATECHKPTPAGRSTLSVSSVGSEAMQRSASGWRRSPYGLSVSSVGSEAMQRVLAQRILWVPAPFSILGRIGGDATPPAQGGEGYAPLAFSILGRIGGDATAPDRVAFGGVEYPFSILGRIGGDATVAGATVRKPVGILSVSSVGSEAMQRGAGSPEGHRGGDTFSILGRIGGDATQPPYPAQTRRKPAFQYPRSDRRRCNATSAVAHLDYSPNFQYPRSDRRRCNQCPEPQGQRPEPHFQYPRSDRRRCNDCGNCATGCGYETFSILGRIGGDATLSW